jgi:hypothetical protein
LRGYLDSMDEPFDEDAYDALIAAMDELIAQADTRAVEMGRMPESEEVA